MAAAETDIREALLLYLKGAAEAVKSGLATEKRFRLLRGMNRSQRLDVMGADLYYLEVFPASIDFADADPSRFARDRAYEYTVALHHRYTDADTYAASSQATWDPIAQAVVEALADGTFLPPSAATHTDRIDIDVTTLALDIQPLDEAFQDVVHTLACTLTCTA